MRGSACKLSAALCAVLLLLLQGEKRVTARWQCCSPLQPLSECPRLRGKAGSCEGGGSGGAGTPAVGRRSSGRTLSFSCGCTDRLASAYPQLLLLPFNAPDAGAAAATSSTNAAQTSGCARGMLPAARHVAPTPLLAPTAPPVPHPSPAPFPAPCSIKASIVPPLSPASANPQFILLTNDDSVTQGVADALLSVTAGRKSLTGCAAAATLFAVGRRDWGQGAQRRGGRGGVRAAG